MTGVKTLSIFAIVFASLLTLGSLLLLVTAQCGCCKGCKRRASIVLVDICFWLMVTSAGVSSLLFLTGVEGLQAYPASTLLWPPVVYCAGWSLALVSRLITPPAVTCIAGRVVSPSPRRHDVNGAMTKAWAEICAFFFVFYAVLLSYFLGMLSLFFQTISDRTPALIGKSSFLQTPGLSARPLLPTSNGADYTTLIFFSTDINDKNTKALVDNLEETLKPYKDALKKPNSKLWNMCGAQGTSFVRSEDNRFCFVNIQQFAKTGVCSEDNNFGYTDGKPCVLLRLNKIYGWIPEPYKSSVDGMSVALKSEITAWNPTGAGRDTIGDLIWLDCFGEDDVDSHNMGSNIEYFPQRGFPVSHFPYKNQYGYLQPAVFVKFNDLKPNIAIKIQCRVFAHNIEFDSRTWAGGFHFELFYKKT